MCIVWIYYQKMDPNDVNIGCTRPDQVRPSCIRYNGISQSTVNITFVGNPNQTRPGIIFQTRAEHKSWPVGFPRLYFLICNLNTYPINMKQPDSESYWLGLSIDDAKTILFWPDWSQNLGLILYFHLQGIALMNSFQKLFFFSNLLSKYSCYK